MSNITHCSVLFCTAKATDPITSNENSQSTFKTKHKWDVNGDCQSTGARYARLHNAPQMLHGISNSGTDSSEDNEENVLADDSSAESDALPLVGELLPEHDRVARAGHAADQEEEQEVQIEIETGGGVQVATSSDGGNRTVIGFPDKSLFLFTGRGNMIYCHVNEDGNPRCEEVDIDD